MENNLDDLTTTNFEAYQQKIIIKKSTLIYLKFKPRKKINEYYTQWKELILWYDESKTQIF